MTRQLFLLTAGAILAICLPRAGETAHKERRLLYVAAPGIPDDSQSGDPGVLVFDIDDGHRFVKRIPLAGFAGNGRAGSIKGICANAATHRLYVTTARTLIAMDLVSDQKIWERVYEGGADRLSITPDGKTIYLPSFEGDHWSVVDAKDGRAIKTIMAGPMSHNTIIGLDGAHAYLAARHSRWLRVVETKTAKLVRSVGPFGGLIRPFTIDGRGERSFMCVNGLLGFEIGDLTTGRNLGRVTVRGFSPDSNTSHGCPSHGIGMTPDEKEIWLVDGANRRLHVFDATKNPPKQVASIALRAEPGWVTFGIDGRYAYPSTGEVIDVAARSVAASLKDDRGRDIQSEKLLEIDFDGGSPSRTGDQFGVGRKAPPGSAERSGTAFRAPG